ncbi:MAG: RNA 3'-terminal phosphate cyclase [Planctomycetes bacterium]|nr:RNA 3'-terminal phosphate cyclase [Planctomycetota bacterium]
MIEIDGSHGEGGGQVLRTSLALSIVTGKPFRLFNIRAGRPNAGLQNQHLACVNAAQQISGADVEGAKIGSRELLFEPAGVFAGNYYFKMDTAGSAGLVLQTVLPALLHADAASSVRVTGGTHNAWAPPAEFLQRAFLPLLGRMGAEATLTLEQHGFYPAGGGLYQADIKPWENRTRLKLLDRRELRWEAHALLSRVPLHVGEREVNIVQSRLHVRENRCWVREVQSPGPGNALTIVADCGDFCEVFSAFGKRGKPAEKVAKEACNEAERWLEAGVPVGEHLADQLLLPMALGAGGRFRTLEPSGHTRTNIETIRKFLDVRITCEQSGDAWTISVES